MLLRYLSLILAKSSYNMISKIVWYFIQYGLNNKNVVQIIIKQSMCTKFPPNEQVIT